MKKPYVPIIEMNEMNIDNNNIFNNILKKSNMSNNTNIKTLIKYLQFLYLDKNFDRAWEYWAEQSRLFWFKHFNTNSPHKICETF